MTLYRSVLLLACLLPLGCMAQPAEQDDGARTVTLSATPSQTSLPTSAGTALTGDVERGRLVFGPCRTCHYPDPALGHNNGPNLYRIFGRVAGKQPGFDYYSDTFKNAEFVWTPQLLDLWLADPRAMFPGSTMMSLGVPDPQRRADLIAYLKQASVRGSEANDTGDDISHDSENSEDTRD